MDQLSEVIDLLREEGLLERVRMLRVGNVSFELGAEALPPPTFSPPTAPPRDEDEEYERTLFASSH